MKDRVKIIAAYFGLAVLVIGIGWVVVIPVLHWDEVFSLKMKLVYYWKPVLMIVIAFVVLRFTLK